MPEASMKLVAVSKTSECFFCAEVSISMCAGSDRGKNAVYVHKTAAACSRMNIKQLFFSSLIWEAFHWTVPQYLRAYAILQAMERCE